MNDSRNRVQLIGNLGTDPEVVNFDNGNKLAKFTLATNSTFKNNRGETQKDVQWHNIVAWGAQAQYASEQLKKGNYIALEGKLVYRSYEDKTGAKKYITEVVLGNILMSGSRE